MKDVAVNIRMPASDIESMNSLIDATGARSRSDVLRKAFCLYKTIIPLLIEGYSIQMVKGEEKTLVLPVL